LLKRDRIVRLFVSDKALRRFGFQPDWGSSVENRTYETGGQRFAAHWIEQYWAKAVTTNG